MKNEWPFITPNRALVTVTFQHISDDKWAPYYSENGDTLSPTDWQEIVTRANRFYSGITADLIDQENERFRRERAKRAREFAMPINQKGLEPSTGWIYVLRAGEYYKIGRAQKPIDRYSQLATLPPWPTEVVHTFESDDYCLVEKELHDIFADKRTNGEWFKLTEEDIAWLKTL